MVTAHKTNSASNLIAVERLTRSIASGSGSPDASAAGPRAIVAFTANPSVDRAYEVVDRRLGALLCVRSVRADGGGNVVKFEPSPSCRVGFSRSLTR
jgi:hypothetical protein